MTDIGEASPCQCRFRNGNQVKECDFHKRQITLVRNRIAQFLEARIKYVFRDTHLHEMRDDVLEEVRRLGTKK